MATRTRGADNNQLTDTSIEKKVAPLISIISYSKSIRTETLLAEFSFPFCVLSTVILVISSWHHTTTTTKKNVADTENDERELEIMVFDRNVSPKPLFALKLWKSGWTPKWGLPRESEAVSLKGTL